MTWKFWKKKFRKSDPLIDIMPMASLFRWYCYDVGIDDIHDLSLSIGLTPISKEAEEEEIKASNARLDSIDYLTNFLDIIAQINTGVMFELNKDLLNVASLSEEQSDRLADLFKSNFYAISISALLAGFSSAKALGLIDKGNVLAAGVTDIK